VSTLSQHAGGTVSGEAAEDSSTPTLATIPESTLEGPADDADPEATSASTPEVASTTFSAAMAVSEAVPSSGASATP